MKRIEAIYGDTLAQAISILNQKGIQKEDFVGVYHINAQYIILYYTEE